MKTKTKKRKNIMLISLFFTFNIIFYIVFQKLNIINGFEIIVNIQIALLLGYLIISIYQLYRMDGLFGKARSYILVGLIALLSLLPAYIIYVYYNESTSVTRGEVLALYGQYLTFLGAFSLGYFIYKKDENNRIEAKKDKCKILLNSIDKTDCNMIRVARHNLKLDKILYDDKWREYYLEFESLTKRKYSETNHILDSYFDTVDLMNLSLARGDYEKAIKIYENHVSNDCYSISKYNLLELKMLILNATYTNEICIRMNLKPWDEKKEVKNVLNQYPEKFFFIVENYIYNYMVQNKKTIVNSREIQKQLVDWLLTSPFIKEVVKWPDEKRIVTKIVFNISLQMNEKSKRISYCWGEYTLN